MSLTLGGKVVPKPIVDILVQVRDRVAELRKKYGSLSRWGRPVVFDIREVAAIFYAVERLGVSGDRLARFIGLDDQTVYEKYVNRVKEVGRVTLTEPGTLKPVEVAATPEQLVDLVESDVLKVKAATRVSDPLQSSVISRFWTSDVKKRVKRPGLSVYLSEDKKREVLSLVKRIMDYMASKGLPNNPDSWAEEEILKVIEEMFDDPAKRRRVMKVLRRVPEWSGWFSGLIGAETSFVKPRATALFYEQYLKLKGMWRRGELSDAEFLTLWLHITTGAREGYSKYPRKTRLDDPQVTASLVGLRWEKLSKAGDYYVLEVWEPKTARTWTCDITWLDAEVAEYFLSKYARKEGNIIRTLTGLETVGEFEEWYTRLVGRVAKELGYPRLTPHDMRASHISILAELGVPMEYALSGMTDLGVGWEDAKTALVFYLRFSRYTRRFIREKIDTERRRIESEVGAG